MKNKALVAAFIILVTTAMGAHAFGVGAQFNFNAGKVFAPGVAAVISPTDNIHLAVNWRLGADSSNIIGVTMDVCPLNFSLFGGFHFTLGGGIFASMVFGDDFGFEAGLRVPVGFSLVMINRVFEIYTHIAPSFGVNFLPSLGFREAFFPIAIGARIWFR